MIPSSIASPRLWKSAFLFWVGTLFLLSSFSKTMPDGGPEIPHIDKILHFGYFFGGGIILATLLLLKKGVGAPKFVTFLLLIAIFAVIGALDEYHQTFTPGRSGNDPFDWLADVLGATTGIALAHAFHPRLLKFSSENPLN
ncbi:MAG: VanZ family protein [Luteolibacter sp.]